jgi:hypothetical protein
MPNPELILEDAHKWLDYCTVDDGIFRGVENLVEKVKPRGFLRVATLSHLRHLYKFAECQAEAVLDNWIATKEHEQCKNS